MTTFVVPYVVRLRSRVTVEARTADEATETVERYLDSEGRERLFARAVADNDHAEFQVVDAVELEDDVPGELVSKHLAN
jgi:hypothetical protein